MIKLGNLTLTPSSMQLNRASKFACSFSVSNLLLWNDGIRRTPICASLHFAWIHCQHLFNGMQGQTSQTKINKGNETYKEVPASTFNCLGWIEAVVNLLSRLGHITILAWFIHNVVNVMEGLIQTLDVSPNLCFVCWITTSSLAHAILSSSRTSGWLCGKSFCLGLVFCKIYRRAFWVSASSACCFARAGVLNFVFVFIIFLVLIVISIVTVSILIFVTIAGVSFFLVDESTIVLNK